MVLDAYSRENWTDIDAVQVAGTEYSSLAFGAYKQVFAEGETVALLPTRGETLEERRLHTAVIDYNERMLREHGVSTATSYEHRETTIDEEVYPVLIGENRDDLMIEHELGEYMRDHPDLAERVYDELFVPIKDLHESGEITTSPLDFINISRRDSSELLYDTRNFGYNPETDELSVIDVGELEPASFQSTGRTPDADLSEYNHVEPEDFAVSSPYPSVKEFLEANNISEDV